VTVVIPAYKESEHIKRTLADIAESFLSRRVRGEILVVLDNVPGDETGARIFEVASKFPEIRVIERQGRRGVGDAIRTGIEQASGRIVIPVMGDQSENPVDILRMVEKAQSYDVVFSNRFGEGKPVGYPLMKYAANRLCNMFVKLLFRLPYGDTTNAFKAYSKDLLRSINLSSNGFEIFLELPLKAMALRPRSIEIPVHHVVRRKKLAKLSVAKDGFRYARVIFSLSKGRWR
jgi:dolichol-phosphate mannosyltransferase